MSLFLGKFVGYPKTQFAKVLYLREIVVSDWPNSRSPHIICYLFFTTFMQISLTKYAVWQDISG